MDIQEVESITTLYEEILSKKLDAKTGWGRKEVKELLKETKQEVVIHILKEQSKRK